MVSSIHLCSLIILPLHVSSIFSILLSVLFFMRLLLCLSSSASWLMVQCLEFSFFLKVCCINFFIPDAQVVQHFFKILHSRLLMNIYFLSAVYLFKVHNRIYMYSILFFCQLYWLEEDFFFYFVSIIDFYSFVCSYFESDTNAIFCAERNNSFQEVTFRAAFCILYQKKAKNDIWLKIWNCDL